MAYQVSSVNKLGSSHRSERTAQDEAAKRLRAGDHEVTIDRIHGKRGAYMFERVEVRGLVVVERVDPFTGPAAVEWYRGMPAATAPAAAPRVWARTDATCTRCGAAKRPAKAYLRLLAGAPYVCNSCKQAQPAPPMSLGSLGVL